ncbi:MAG: PmoA family protein [Thermomicrobiales bacterium]|nr:PmoA family protein [Thermomicrobiales bacterium]
MHLDIDDTAVTFRFDGQIAGRYVYADDFKPYLHPLNTPAGHTVSLASPHDHKHHKGLMYALTVPGVNFWEERPTAPHELVGRQRHENFGTLLESGDEIGFDEEITWLPVDGGEPVFRETRTVTCRIDAAERGFLWTWNSELSVLHETELTTSVYSVRQTDGRLVNYHGLGIRFRREFGCTGGNLLLINGHETPIGEGSGSTPASAEFQGSIDGIWPVVRAAVRISQEMPNGLFVMDKPFAFMGCGPSNLGPVPLHAGTSLSERYTIQVFDVGPA